MAIVYLETSIISHAAARPNSNVAVQALQLSAKAWWDFQRTQFELVTSQIVLDEAAVGDPGAAAERLQLLQGIRLVPVNDEVRKIADTLISRSLMPAKAYVDALHVACAAAAGVEYLLTLNCRHIANARTLPGVYVTLAGLGVAVPLVCTPAEFLGEKQ